MTFALLLFAFFALLHLPPLRRLPALATPEARAAVAAGLFFIGAGALHFAMPARYDAMIPPQLPSPRFWVLLSGALQIAGGVGLLSRRTRRPAALGLIALLVAILPANLHEAVRSAGPKVLPMPDWYFWLRIPFQLVYIAWVAWAGGLLHLKSRARLPAHG